MAADTLNRVGLVISDTGTGNLTANTLISNAYNLPGEAGAVDGHTYYWLLERDLDYQLFEGIYTASGTSVARTTTLASKIGGTYGTSNIDIQSGDTATLRSVTPKEMFDHVLREDQASSIASAATTDIWSILGSSAHITGSTGITSFGTASRAGLWRILIFDGAVPITRNSSTLETQNQESFVTEAGGMALVYADTTSKAIIVFYQPKTKAAARALISAAPLDALAYNGLQINGNGEVSQELATTGLTLVSNTAAYVVDTMQAAYKHAAGTAVVTSAKIAAASFPTALAGFPSGVQLKATTAITSPADLDYALHRHIIGGYRMARLAWGTASAMPLAYAFYFYSTASGTAFVKFSNSSYARCYYHEITVAAGWNYFSGTIVGDTSGTWNVSTGVGLFVEVFSAGVATSPASTLDAWGTANKVQTTNSTNLLGTNNNLTILTGLLILPGIELPEQTRLPFIMRPYPVERELCKFYYETSYSDGVAVGTATAIGVVAIRATGTTDFVAIRYTEKVTIPTVTSYNYNSGASGTWRDVNGAADRTANSSNPSTKGSGINVSASTALSNVAGHWVANSRL